MMINNSLISEARSLLKVEMFWEPINRRIYEFALELHDRGMVVDPASMKARFAREQDIANLSSQGIDYIVRCVESAVAVVNGMSHARIIRDTYNLREIIRISDQAQNACYDPQSALSWSDIANDLRDSISHINATSGADVVRKASDVLMVDLVEHIQTPPQPLSTGLSLLDESMGGGLMRGEMAVIEGKAKAFKSGILGTAFHHAMRERGKVMYITLELSGRAILQRLVGGYSEMDYRSLERTERLEDAMAAVVMYRSEHPGIENSFVAHVPGIEVGGLMALCERAVGFYGCETLLIDYWQRVTGRDRDDGGQAAFLERLANRLADFAATTKTAIFTASQLNRGGLSFGSGGISRACSWAASVNRVQAPGPYGIERAGIWLSVTESRFGKDDDIGSEESPAFYIATGPVLKEWD